MQPKKKIPIGPPADPGSKCACGRFAQAKCLCGKNFCAACWWRHSHGTPIRPPVEGA